jgi:hypothetical protein
MDSPEVMYDASAFQAAHSSVMRQIMQERMSFV